MSESAKCKNIIRSASAGTGKTTSMINRIAEVCRKTKTPLKNILVITFTNAATNDIRTKLEKKLRSEFADDVFVSEEVGKISNAPISTIDSFCARLVKDWFYKVNVDPNFSILDENSAEYLKKRQICIVLEKYYAMNSTAFVRLAQFINNDRSDNALTSMILTVYDKIRVLEDPFKCFAQYQENTVNDGVIAENDRMFSDILLEHTRKSYEHFHSKSSELHKLCKLNKMTKYAEFCADIFSFSKSVMETTDVKTMTSLFLTMPSFTVREPKKSEQSIQMAYELYDRVKKLVEEFRSLRDSLAYWKTPSVFTLQDASQITRAFIEILKSFDEAYSKEKERLSKLDYADCLNLALKLTNSEDVLCELHDTYKYVFADECQDNNELQFKLIDRIAHNNNLFSVGDVKQSIYAFRGTDPSLFDARCKTAESDSANYDFSRLDTNFRTNREIISFVNAVFDSIMTQEVSGTDYVSNERLTPAVDSDDKTIRDVAKTFETTIADKTELLIVDPQADADTGATPFDFTANGEINNGRPSDNDVDDDVDSNVSSESRIIYKKILEVVGQTVTDAKYVEERKRDGKTEKLDFGDVVILVRSKSKAVMLIYESLKKLGIPVSCEFNARMNDYPSLTLLTNYLRILDNADQDVALINVMKSFIFDFSDDELAKIALFSSTKHFDYFHSRLTYFCENAPDSPLLSKCHGFKETVNRHCKLSRLLSLTNLLLLIIDEFSFEEHLAFKAVGEEEFSTVTEFILSLDSQSVSPSVGEFIKYVDEFGDSIKINSSFSMKSNSVRITTMHNSKGLEYPVAILCCLNERFHRKNKNKYCFDRENGIAFKSFDLNERAYWDNLRTIASDTDNYRKELISELNVLYVAMTRAKVKLILCGTMADANTQPIDDSDEIKLSYFEQFNANNPLEMLLSAIRKNGEIRRYCKITHVNSAVEIDSFASKNDKITLKTVDGIENTKLFREYNADYPHKDSLFIKQKYTVTELNSEHIAELTNQTDNKGIISPDIEISLEVGNVYHKLFELFDFEEYEKTGNIDGIIAKIVKEKAVTPEQLSRTNNKLIRSMIENIYPLMKGARIYREKDFILCDSAAKYAKCGSIDDEKVLIQGKIDLLLINEDVNGAKKATVIDFKMSAKSASYLKLEYEKQLSLYKKAVTEILGIDCVNCFIYSIAEMKLITMD